MCFKVISGSNFYEHSKTPMREPTSLIVMSFMKKKSFMIVFDGYSSYILEIVDEAAKVVSIKSDINTKY